MMPHRDQQMSKDAVGRVHPILARKKRLIYLWPFSSNEDPIELTLRSMDYHGTSFSHSQ